MSLKDKFPDFFRLSKDLRAMRFDFTKPSNVKRVKINPPAAHFTKDANPFEMVETVEYVENPEAVISDDVDLEDATLLTSRHRFGRAKFGGKGVHRVVLDIDHDAALIPSSTPGHYHLIIDVALGWPDYKELLTALAKAKVIEAGYASASIAKGYTAIRPPWVKKNLPTVKHIPPPTKTMGALSPLGEKMLKEQHEKKLAVEKLLGKEFDEWKTGTQSPKLGTS